MITHEWAWGDVGRRTVCGLARNFDRLQVVTDLGQLDASTRCKNCDRMRAVLGTSSKPAPRASSAAPANPTPAEIAELAAALTERELDIMMHATGWESKWPLFRNHFCASEGHDDWSTLQGLCERGLMKVKGKGKRRRAAAGEHSNGSEPGENDL